MRHGPFPDWAAAGRFANYNGLMITGHVWEGDSLYCEMVPLPGMRR